MHQLISLPAACAQTSTSRSHLYELINTGQFPRPVKVGARRIAFVQAEIDAWVKSRIADRDGKAGSA